MLCVLYIITAQTKKKEDIARMFCFVTWTIKFNTKFKNLKKNENVQSQIKIRHLQSTVRGCNFGGGHVNRTLPNLTAVQRFERRRCHVETMPGSVDGGHIDRCSVRRVSDAPAPAAVRRVPRDIESTADVRVVGNLVERREPGDEAVGPVRARDAVERAGGVVEEGVERGP